LLCAALLAALLRVRLRNENVEHGGGVGQFGTYPAQRCRANRRTARRTAAPCPAVPGCRYANAAGFTYRRWVRMFGDATWRTEL